MEVAVNDSQNEENYSDPAQQTPSGSQPLTQQNLTGVAAMRPSVTLLKDYQPPSYQIPDAHLNVAIEGDEVTVTSRLTCKRASGVDAGVPLTLQGEGLPVISVKVDGKTLSDKEYSYEDGSLKIDSLPDTAVVEIVTREKPADNKSGSGLYKTSNILCTQMEAEGFRKFTFFSDRPDVLTKYTTTISADTAEFPVLLSNGNQVSESTDAAGRRSVTWEDPYPKPAYLFALVAGDLEVVQDTFTTRSGREVLLEIYVNKGREHLCSHALHSLKQSMKWDEDVFNLEYDLDRYMIVAVDDFNAGAMENKGLNVFNASYVLADPETATDADFLAVQGVIAHEYFHNYTGNRVTLRDWFQLTLKEGLTVLRDQEFSSDMNSRPVKRIQDVKTLRQAQFPEDAGPNAHPIRPDSYVEIDNFYTATVYNKGAEVLRMLQTMVGRDQFNLGVETYLKKYDGQAVTTEEFIGTIEEVSGRDFSQFRRWYDQAGTPELSISSDYDADKAVYRLTVSQNCPPTPGQPVKDPFHIPVRVALLAADGSEIEVSLEGSVAREHLLELTEGTQVFEFSGVTEEPVPSLLRDFSAPVKVNYPYTNSDLTFLLAHDSDPFNRYEASQRVFLSMFKEMGDALRQGKQPVADSECLSAFDALLNDASVDPAFKALALTPPALATIGELWSPFDVEPAAEIQKALYQQLCQRSANALDVLYHDLVSSQGQFEITNEAVGKRSLQNRILAMRVYGGDSQAIEDAYNQYQQAENMTDRLAAFSILVSEDSKYSQTVIDDFYNRYNTHPQVMDKWIAIQASATKGEVLENVQELEKHAAYDRHSPNKVRSLVRTFAANLEWFHKADGSGYAYVADKILEVDAYNPNVAAALAKTFHRYRQLDNNHKALVEKELEKILLKDGISPGVYEIVTNTLKS